MLINYWIFLSFKHFLSTFSVLLHDEKNCPHYGATFLQPSLLYQQCSSSGLTVACLLFGNENLTLWAMLCHSAGILWPLLYQVGSNAQVSTKEISNTQETCSRRRKSTLSSLFNWLGCKDWSWHNHVGPQEGSPVIDWEQDWISHQLRTIHLSLDLFYLKKKQFYWSHRYFRLLFTYNNPKVIWHSIQLVLPWQPIKFYPRTNRCCSTK